MNSTDAVFHFDWSLPGAFIWGLLVLISLAGWGRLVNLWLDPLGRQNPFGWGMATAMGMTAFLIFSGPMLMWSLFSTTFVALFLLVGWALLAGHVHLTRRKKEVWLGPPTLGLKAFLVLLCIGALVTYAGAAAARWYNDGDDFVAYFGFSKMALTMGTLADPFNFRLLGSVGGQPVLTTLVVAFLPWKCTHLLDMGIAQLIVLGLTVELVQGRDARAWIARLVLVALALTFPMPINNTGSEFTGVVLFLAVFRWLGWCSTRQFSGGKSAFILGTVVAAASTLRCHNIFFIAVLGGGHLLFRLLEREQGWRTVVRETLIALITAVVLLIPWWVVTYRSSGAFLYPLIMGTQQPDADQFTYHLSHLEEIRLGADFLASNGYLLFFVPICLLAVGRERREMFFLGLPLFLISTLFIIRVAGTEFFHMSRYLDPMGLAFAIYTGGGLTRQWIETTSSLPSSSWSWKPKLIAFFVIGLLLFQGPNFLVRLHINAVHILQSTNARMEMVAHCAGGPRLAPIDGEMREYTKAFALIPPGSKTLTALDYDFLLDYRTHTIYSVDFVGVASPAPGLPSFRGPEPLKQYLLAQGIRYVAHVPFDRSNLFHGRKVGTAMLLGLPVYQRYGERTIDFSNNVDELAKSNRVLYDSPTIRVIDLGQP